MRTAQTVVASSPAPGAVTRAGDHLEVNLYGVCMRFHYVWLRDNCGCPQCRVAQSGERRVFTAGIPLHLRPTEAVFDTESRSLQIIWQDGHRSRYRDDWLTRYDYSRPRSADSDTPRPLWNRHGAPIPSFAHADVVGSTEGQLAYLDAIHDVGAAVVHGTPTESHEVDRFSTAIGCHVRETAFERVHNVRHDAAGYNVAHTAHELKPHTDLPKLPLAPVHPAPALLGQRCGGRSEHPDRRVGPLVRAPGARSAGLRDVVPHPGLLQLFSPSEDTRATSPLVQLDPRGDVIAFRFSNQLALPIDAAFDDVPGFYDATRSSAP